MATILRPATLTKEDSDLIQTSTSTVPVMISGHEKRFYFSVEKKNSNAQRFYKRHGFVVTGQDEEEYHLAYGPTVNELSLEE